MPISWNKVGMVLMLVAIFGRIGGPLGLVLFIIGAVLYLAT